MRAERLALLGADTVKDIHDQVDAAPDPDLETVARLRRVWTRPAGRTRQQAPAVEAA